MNLPSELVLDYKIWRCGGPHGYNVVGKGCTYLLNCDGYMCCLGQFCQQSGVAKAALYGKNYPNSLTLAPKLFVSNGHLTDLAGRAAEINDDMYWPVAHKVVRLQKLFKQYKKTIVLKNFPKDILKQIEELTN